jgi:tetratricopeptide (TPR) repeat protein
VTFALRAEPAVQPTNTADVQRELAELRASNEKLQQRLEALANAPAPATASLAAERSAAPAVSSEQIAAAVEAFLKKNGAASALAAGATAPTGAAAFDLANEFAKLQGSSFFEDGELWKRLFAAGKIDEAIKMFEEVASANPNDTKAQMDLANAYLSYLQLDQSKYPLAEKADKSFDKVLALDEKHWEARFSKAMSYSFWPDFTGKPKEAITHFEKLVSQQESMPVEAHQAQTYMFLGNLLEARDPAKAKEVWKKGARRHPDNADLANKAK